MTIKQTNGYIITRIIREPFPIIRGRADGWSKNCNNFRSFIGIVVVVAWRMGRERSGFKSVITKFMEAGAARNMGAAYACWSPHSVTEEDIAKFIESSYNVFAGYERLTINDQWTRSGVGGITEGNVSGAIIHTDGKDCH